ncbi:DUF389 domain-containing protein [Sphingosinicella microcystinivorans]|uniref:Hydrophobic protein (TIGR00271 family) n=1 Tax=Sphingosinicella microcystinivorans TaxID=335406 RepID=A0AAD1D875_SPHMI|nr:DUF389 domain-containing protein [Sphingosinicella microcystinivorans]RKS86568.1 putative hydrophobic protein (TIGR00271 family) [Sphingosinicella microcystinivorans]BBE35325.1 hypothetical protein SmB9_29830 [Sphingosinicella microcystinivorans]
MDSTTRKGLKARIDTTLHQASTLWRRQRAYWRRWVVRSVNHMEVAAKLDGEAHWSARFGFMLIMSAGIAVLGLLLSSPAVVIGAMLISPLMGPIMALGFSLARFNLAEARLALTTLGIGVAAAVGFCALVVYLSPLQAVTPEILARTRPNFFDLLVAIFSALAGAYAVIRGRGETIVGVAIATALMPPLAVVGYGLATLNGLVFFGALGLFMTNLLAIALSAAVMAKMYGFGTAMSDRSTRIQTIGILGIFAILSVPLLLSLHQIAWEALASRLTREAISAYFGPDSRISQLEMDFSAEPIVARATVQTPKRRYDADQQISARLRARLEEPIAINLAQVLVDSDATLKEREQRELEAAKRAQGESLRKATEADAQQVAAELAILGAQSPSAVNVDLARRYASMTAEAMPGIRLPAWRALETRVAIRHPGWTVMVIPPVGQLPLIPFDEDSAALSPKGMEAVVDAAWALKRWGITTVLVNGRVASGEADSGEARDKLAEDRAAAVAAVLGERGIKVASRSTTSGAIQKAAEDEFGRSALRSVELVPDTLAEAPSAAR